ncbi:MAG: nitrous oxide reductase family maturation protein NosD [Gammaproteobacteria bacterium]|nr:nitrous oxide reductase family maturation protein NosD [Gammaproteobacteria bacterium]
MKIRLSIAFFLFGISLVNSALASVISVSPDDDLQHALDLAEEGDHLLLESGLYQGNFNINKAIELSGKQDAVLDGNAQGHTLKVNAPNVNVHHLRIQNWGKDLTDLNAGIFITKTANNVRINDTYLFGDSFGIWVDGSNNVQVLNNYIEGNQNIRSPDRGNGIHLYNVTGALIHSNEVWHTRDGIYIESSNGNELSENYLHDLRYGIHYMYSYHNIVTKNYTQNTRTGYALMQSKFLTVTGNHSENDVNYGILMNFITKSTITNNVITGVQNQRNIQMRHSKQGYQPEGKALFIYNSLFNQIQRNVFADSDIGIHITAGSEDNTFSENAFISNTKQVKYVSNRRQDWSTAGRGNYWSDYLGWDMDGDNKGDVAYEPNDGVDRLLWKYPTAKLLFNSPAIAVLRWVQRQFPVLQSPGIVDNFPLMSLPMEYPQ